jgi:hypothetical protein
VRLCGDGAVQIVMYFRRIAHVRINPLHGYYRADHLERVVQEMRHRGPPTIRAYFDGDTWHAREGTHRLRAAKILGLAPTLVCVAWRRSVTALQRARFQADRHAHVFNFADVMVDGPLVD